MSLPVFQYHPDPFRTGVFKRREEAVTCPCCGKETHVTYEGPFYSVENVKGLCPGCIASGAAAKKFDGEFQDSYSVDEVSDSSRLDELVHRTPGYCGWQQEYWRAHCDDFCAYLGNIDYQGLVDLGVTEEVLEDPNLDPWYTENLQDLGQGTCGYLFQCLHCGKHLLHVDCD